MKTFSKNRGLNQSECMNPKKYMREHGGVIAKMLETKNVRAPWKWRVAMFLLVCVFIRLAFAIGLILLGNHNYQPSSPYSYITYIILFLLIMASIQWIVRDRNMTKNAGVWWSRKFHAVTYGIAAIFWGVGIYDRGLKSVYHSAAGGLLVFDVLAGIGQFTLLSTFSHKKIC